MRYYHVYIDPTMVINALSTDYQESKEFLQWSLAPFLFFWGFLPCYIVWHINIYKRSLASYWTGRLSTIFLSLMLFFLGGWAVFNDLSPIHREHKELVYLITPLNVFSSTMKAFNRIYGQSEKQRLIMDEDAHQIPRSAANKPRAIVLVIGETVRAANWGLNGYSRQTTPKLAKHQVINFQQVSSCGTSTAVSLPCMFSPYGFHAYDEQLINSTESLLHLLHRSQISILWRDNQSGCKGVCDRLPMEKLKIKSLCHHGRCFDAVLLHQLKERIENKKRDQLIVLHMLGNHGPAYYQRYPKQFEQWQPVCETTNLSSCSQQSIINTYDNAILYTDTVLAQAIDQLKLIKTHDTALIYLSDHGESLGEHNLFLHGLPYFMAPEEQKKIPFIMWLSREFISQLKLNEQCLRQQEKKSISHDYLFSTLLSLFDIKTKNYNAQLDLTHNCRQPISLT